MRQAFFDQVNHVLQCIPCLLLRRSSRSPGYFRGKEFRRVGLYVPSDRGYSERNVLRAQVWRKPEDSATYVGKEYIGSVSMTNYPRIESVVNVIEPPKKQSMARNELLLRNR